VEKWGGRRRDGAMRSQCNWMQSADTRRDADKGRMAVSVTRVAEYNMDERQKRPSVQLINNKPYNPK
jgi:hypothetical protein